MSIEFEFSELEVQAGMDAIVMKAVNGDDPSLSYQPLAEASVAALERGVENARYTVIAQMVIDGTLALMRQPSVERRLSREITERKLVAMKGARIIGDVAAKSMLFTSMLVYTPVLRSVMDEADLTQTRKGGPMGVLGSSAFSDAGIVIGGAHRKLRPQSLNEPTADVIARSTSLPREIRRIDADQTDRAFRSLGRPYVLPRYLKVIADNQNRPEVIFAEEAKPLIRSLTGPEGGCPAARMSNVARDGTVLTDAWKDIVSVLVPENATTKFRNIS